MKSKIAGLLCLSILSLVLFISAVSAVTLAEWDFEDSDLIVDTGTGTLSLSDSRTATYFTGNSPSSLIGMSSTDWDVADRYIELSIDTTGYEDLILKFDYQASGTGPANFQIQYSSDGTTFTNLGSTTTIPGAFTANPMSTFDFSSITTIDNNVNTEFRILVPSAGVASGSSGTFRIDNLVIEGTEPEPEPVTCGSITEGSLRVDIKDITVVHGFGDDEEWLPLDEIEVEIEIENKNNDEKIKDIEVEWGLYSEETDEWVIELDDVDEFDLKKDSDEMIKIEFKLDEKKLDIDLDELEDGDYTLYVRAIGEEQEEPEFEVCSINSESVKVVIEEDFVILNDFQFPELVSCGTDVQFTADVWNIGDSDQDDVYVMVYNKELGINEKIEIGDIDAFEDEKLVFDLQVPKDTEERWYTLKFTVYDEDDDVYENDYDDEESVFRVPFKVEGNCVAEPQAVVTANLESGGKAGQELVIKATLTNTGDELVTYQVNAAGYSDWASSVELDQSTIILSAGGSNNIWMTFQVKKDVYGDKLFDIEVLSGGELILTQPVSVSIEESTGFPGITGDIISRENWYIWGFGALIVVLVIVIAFVVTIKSKRSRSP